MVKKNAQAAALKVAEQAEYPDPSQFVTGSELITEVAREAMTLPGLVSSERNLVVSDGATLARGRSLLVDLTRRIDDGEEKRKRWSGPLDKAAKTINAMFRSTFAEAVAARDSLKQKVGGYVAAENDRRERALAAQRQTEQEAQRAATARAEKAGLPPPVVIPKAAPPEVATHAVQADGAATTVKMEWDYEVTDEAALRAAKPGLFDLSRSRTLALIRSGERDVPGLRVFQKPNVSVRA